MTSQRLAQNTEAQKTDIPDPKNPNSCPLGCNPSPVALNTVRYITKASTKAPLTKISKKIKVE
jgi:hypothetical protein